MSAPTVVNWQVMCELSMCGLGSNELLKGCAFMSIMSNLLHSVSILDFGEYVLLWLELVVVLLLMSLK